MDLDLGAMRLLVGIADTGSVTGAAELAGITSSAASQQLKHLQLRLGVPLTAREGRGIVLTPHGHQLVDGARPILEATAELEAGLVAGAAEPKGPLRIATFASAARGLGPAIVAGVLERLPDLDLSLTIAEPDEALSLLERGRVEVALLHGFVPEGVEERPSCMREEVLADPLVCFGADDGTGPVDLRDLGDRRWLLPDEGSGCERVVRALLAEHGVVPDDVAAVSAEFDVLARLARAGLGVTLVPQLVVAGDPAPGGRPLLQAFDRSVAVSVLRRRRREPVVALALQAVRDAAAAQAERVAVAAAV
jgi:DNA-binding transcriptional LysR family regulator